jgi:hypothetical protein
MLYVILHCKKKYWSIFRSIFGGFVLFQFLFTPQFSLSTHLLLAPRTSMGAAIPTHPLSAFLASNGRALPIYEYSTTSRATPNTILPNLFWATLVYINTTCRLQVELWVQRHIVFTCNATVYLKSGAVSSYQTSRIFWSTQRAVFKGNCRKV